jgi:predicted transcriptional regulator
MANKIRKKTKILHSFRLNPEISATLGKVAKRTKQEKTMLVENALVRLFQPLMTRGAE